MIFKRTSGNRWGTLVDKCPTMGPLSMNLIRAFSISLEVKSKIKKRIRSSLIPKMGGRNLKWWSLGVQPWQQSSTINLVNITSWLVEGWMKKKNTQRHVNFFSLKLSKQFKFLRWTSQWHRGLWWHSTIKQYSELGVWVNLNPELLLFVRFPKSVILANSLRILKRGRK